MITNKWPVELSTNSQQLERRQLYVKVMDPFCLWGILLLVKFILSWIVKISIMLQSLWILSPMTTSGCTAVVELHQPCEEKGYRKNQSGLSKKWQVPCYHFSPSGQLFRKGQTPTILRICAAKTVNSIHHKSGGGNYYFHSKEDYEAQYWVISVTSYPV